MSGTGKQGKPRSAAARTTRRIGDPGAAVPVGSDQQHPNFSFRHVDTNNYLLQDWEKDEIKQLVKRLILLEQLTWHGVKTHGGLRWKTLDTSSLRCAIPANIPEEQTIAEFRVSQRMRVMGYRQDRTFYLVWFDRNHEVTG